MLITEIANSQTVKTYKLDNGLTVILAEDHSEPKVFGAVAVKVGSKNDPEDKTGMAHYFEHVMFKGTDKIGTVDYVKEKPYLDLISELYDKLATVADNDLKRNEILKQINIQSIEASKYAIPGEIDKLLKKYGGAGINAYTGYDHTVYHNTFSPDYMEKWLAIYAERFRNPVFRMFQAELETVYEERNMYADIMGSKAVEDLTKRVLKKHPYRNPIIGTVKDLKNPSLSRMTDFYKKYYVAGNMALILAGNFDSEKIIPLIEQTFGKHPAGKAPVFDLKKYMEEPFVGREFFSGRYVPLKAGVICFRGVASADPDKVALDCCMSILSNKSQTGLLDQLRTDSKVMFATGIQLSMNDLGVIAIVFAPKLSGSLKKTESKITAVINDLKSGNFSDELFESIKISIIKNNAMLVENKVKLGNLLVELFSSGQTWEEYIARTDRYRNITKQELIDAANRYFTDNRLVFYNKPGFSGKAEKISKPDYAPLLSVNGNAQSTFAKELATTKVKPNSPKFVDFSSDFKYGDIQKNVHLVTGKNSFNEVFTLKFRFGYGTNASKLMELLPKHLPELGTESRTVKEFRSAMQKLGASYEMEAHRTSFDLKIDGFDKNFEETIVLFNDFLKNIKPDDKQMSKLLHDVHERNKIECSDINALSDAHFSRIVMGGQSEYLGRLSIKEIKKLQSSDMTDLFKNIQKYETAIIYVGNIAFDSVREIIASKVDFPENMLDADKSFFEVEDYSSNLISVFNYRKANQVVANFYVPGMPAINDSDIVAASFFNSYFGIGMSSIMFHEIRELRSLSYSANAQYFFSNRKYAAFKGYMLGNIAIQADKTAEAVELVDSLIKNMPQKAELIKDIKNSYKESINNSLPTFREIPEYGYSLIEQGYGEDFRKTMYDSIDSLTMETVNRFYEKYIKGKPLIHVLSGNKAKMNLDKLNIRKQELKLKDILR
ncbi:MAG: insulinase family protein [Prevotellaceae bacterium]|nr:insulinase family protein [Prevotellaceae bacterium]